MIRNYHYQNMNISAFQKPKNGQTCCGDSYFLKETKDYFICALVDGLGSGAEAKKASERAVSAISENHNEDIASLMKTCNKELRFGRGAVLSIFKIKYDSRELAFSGIGNVRFVFFLPNGKKVSPMPTLGFLSGKPLVPKVQTFPFENGTSFAMYTDGLAVNLGRQDFFTDISPQEASEHVKQLVLNNQSIQDDVTFLYGKNIAAKR
ncbi:MAG TPA: SpoIIE family protein phosphatase [Bacillales bacterium]|nr:SpoIIE family protein phosphatase [Bacillales bacterium]